MSIPPSMVERVVARLGGLFVIVGLACRMYPFRIEAIQSMLKCCTIPWRSRGRGPFACPLASTGGGS